MNKSENNIQPGCIVKIRRDTKRMRIDGFKEDTEHIIQNPPKNHINSLMSVFLKTKKGKLKQIPFYYFLTTAKKEKVKKLKRKIKRKRKIKH